MLTGLFIFMGWRTDNFPGLHFQWGDTKGYISFGLYRVGAMAINQFNSRVDQLVIGAFLGPVALGYYSIAFSLVMQPIQKINPILTQVAFPVFSIVQHNTSRLKSGFLKMIRFLMFINAPILVGMSTVAPLAVPLLIGNKWVPSVPIVQILAFYALIRSLGNAGGSLIVAKGKANWTFYWNMALLLIIPATLYGSITLGGSILHVAFALVGLQLLLFLFHYRMFIRNLIGPCFLEYVHNIGRPVLLSFVMSIIILACSLFVQAIPIAAILSIQVSLGALIYIMLSWLFNKKLSIEVLDLLPSKFRLGKFLKQFE